MPVLCTSSGVSCDSVMHMMAAVELPKHEQQRKALLAGCCSAVPTTISSAMNKRAVKSGTYKSNWSVPNERLPLTHPLGLEVGDEDQVDTNSSNGHCSPLSSSTARENGNVTRRFELSSISTNSLSNRLFKWKAGILENHEYKEEKGQVMRTKSPATSLWSANDYELLLQLQKKHGNKWKFIAEHFPGRSRINVKNRWYSTQRRKLRAEDKSSNGGIDGSCSCIIAAAATIVSSKKRPSIGNGSWSECKNCSKLSNPHKFVVSTLNSAQPPRLITSEFDPSSILAAKINSNNSNSNNNSHAFFVKSYVLPRGWTAEQLDQANRISRYDPTKITNIFQHRNVMAVKTKVKTVKKVLCAPQQTLNQQQQPALSPAFAALRDAAAEGDPSCLQCEQKPGPINFDLEDSNSLFDFDFLFPITNEKK